MIQVLSRYMIMGTILSRLSPGWFDLKTSNSIVFGVGNSLQTLHLIHSLDPATGGVCSRTVKPSPVG